MCRLPTSSRTYWKGQYVEGFEDVHMIDLGERRTRRTAARTSDRSSSLVPVSRLLAFPVPPAFAACAALS